MCYPKTDKHEKIEGYDGHKHKKTKYRFKTLMTSTLHSEFDKTLKQITH